MKAKTINATPSWTAMVGICVTLIERGDNDGRLTAIEELNKMATLADLYVASVKPSTLDGNQREKIGEVVQIKLGDPILTAEEAKVLEAFILEGVGCNSSDSPEHLKSDNMTWADRNDIAERLGITPGGAENIMHRLEGKGLIADSGESHPNEIGRKLGAPHAFYATDKGIDVGWKIMEANS